MDERFVGRSTELTFLRERLDEARRAPPRVVLLEGAVDIGKTFVGSQPGRLRVLAFNITGASASSSLST
jgi:hypothetical protein